MNIDDHKTALYFYIARMNKDELKHLTYLMELWDYASMQLGNNAQLKTQENLHDFSDKIIDRLSKRGM